MIAHKSSPKSSYQGMLYIVDLARHIHQNVTLLCCLPQNPGKMNMASAFLLIIMGSLSRSIKYQYYRKATCILLN